MVKKKGGGVKTLNGLPPGVRQSVEASRVRRLARRVVLVFAIPAIQGRIYLGILAAMPTGHPGLVGDRCACRKDTVFL